MILDSRTEFCDATALNTGSAATYLVGNQIDLGDTANDPGNGEPIYLVILCQTTAGSGGSATLQLHLASDSTASIATDGSATYHWSSRVFALASVTAGTVLAIVPLPWDGYERYLGILQTTAVAAFNAGKIDAFLTKDPSKWQAYPDAI